jgi:PAS domain S-box-containing protein
MPDLGAQNLAIRGSRLGNLLERFPHATTVANQDNRLVFANRAFTRLYGWTEREIISLTPRILVPVDFPEDHLRKVRREISAAATGWCGKLENVTKTGRRFLARIWAARIRPGPDLPFLYYVGLTIPADSGVRPEEELTSLLAGAMLHEKPPKKPATRIPSRPEMIENLRSLGYSTKEIAQVLGVAANTVNVALHRERRRTGPGNHGSRT